MASATVNSEGNIPNVFNLPLQGFAKITKGVKTAEIGFISRDASQPGKPAILVTAPWSGSHAGNDGSILLDLSTGDIDAASIYGFGMPSPLHGGNLFRYEHLLDSLADLLRTTEAPAQSLVFLNAVKDQLESAPGMHALAFGEGNTLWGWYWHQANPVAVDYLAPKDSEILIQVLQDQEVLFSQRVAIKGGTRGHYATSVSLPVEKAKPGNTHLMLDVAIVPPGGDWSQQTDYVGFGLLLDKP